MTAIIQKPSGKNDNHSEACKKKQQPSRSFQEMTTTIQNPVQNNTQTSRSLEEMTATMQKALGNNNNHPKASKKYNNANTQAP